MLNKLYKLISGETKITVELYQVIIALFVAFILGICFTFYGLNHQTYQEEPKADLEKLYSDYYNYTEGLLDYLWDMEEETLREYQTTSHYHHYEIHRDSLLKVIDPKAYQDMMDHTISKMPCKTCELENL